MANPTQTNVLFVIDTLYAIANNSPRIYVTDDYQGDAPTGPGGNSGNPLSFTVHSQQGATINFNQTSINPNCGAVLTNLVSTGNVVAPSMQPQGWSATVLGTGTDTLTLTYYCQNSTTPQTATVQFSVSS